MNKIINAYQKSKVAIALSTAIVLGGCGGTDQDEGVASSLNQVFGGQAIDGYVARATVYIDTNNDGTRNAWEPFAFTDNEGYFSYNPNTDTDYCGDTATSLQKQYCLSSNTSYNEAVIRIDGGYDVITGEPFLGQLSRRVSDVPDTGTENVLVTPLSSILTNVESSQDQTSVLSSLGLTMDAIDVDYLNTDGNGGVDTNILNAALKVHKIVAVLSDRLTDTYTDIGDELGTPNDATSAIYPNLADQIIASSMSFDDLVTDDQNLANVLDNAESDLQALYERKDFDLPADLGSVTNLAGFSRIIDVASSITNVVNSLVPVDTILTGDEATGASKAIESVVIKSVEEVNIDETLDNAVTFFTQGEQELVTSLLQNLALSNSDLSGLTNNDFTGSDFDSVEDIVAVSVLSDDAQPFTQIGGLSLKVSDLDLGSAPNNLEDKEVEFYFNGEATDTEGSFQACVKYIDEASIDGTLGEGNTRGELIDGFWSLLGASDTDNESYNMLMTITFLGTTYQAILKPSGSETVNNINYKTVRFDFDGELVEYHSADGLVSTNIIPSTNEECEARLPSRVGI